MTAEPRRLVKARSPTTIPQRNGSSGAARMRRAQEPAAVTISQPTATNPTNAELGQNLHEIVVRVLVDRRRKELE